MTSSAGLQQRFRDRKIWANIGPWYDTYVEPFNECLPDYYAVPIGGPEGVKMCVRKRRPDGTDPKTADPRDVKINNGYYKYSMRLYDLPASPDGLPHTNPYPIQASNPYPLEARRPVHQNYYYQRDYYRNGFNHDGTGILGTRTPGVRKYYETGYDLLPTPPPKFDITRLQQPYDIWKASQDYFIYNRDPPTDATAMSPNPATGVADTRVYDREFREIVD